MGQIISLLLKWFYSNPNSRNDGKSRYIPDHEVNYEAISLDDEVNTAINQQDTHCIIDIPDYDKDLDPQIQVEIKSGIADEDVGKKKKKKKKKEKKKEEEKVIEKTVTVTTEINNVAATVRNIGQYNSRQMILLVGEGDFSFSACLAVAFGSSAVNIIATSLNSQDFLIQNYGKFLSNKAKLENNGSTVLHEVDATRMVKHPLLRTMLFDRIIFNFPHSGKFGETDSELQEHKNLLRGFIRNAKRMIKEDGEIHITSKSNGFYLKWDIPKIGHDQGLQLIQEIKFRKSKYPGYNTKYGFGGDKNFDCNPSKTYKFSFSQK